MKIFLLEDDLSIGKFLVSFLESYGHTVELVEDGHEAAFKINEIIKFDCVISDYNMPQMNGIKFLKTIKESSAQLPVILFTAHSKKTPITEIIPTGINIVYNKDIIKLVDYIKEFSKLAMVK